MRAETVPVDNKAQKSILSHLTRLKTRSESAFDARIDKRLRAKCAR